MTVTTQGSILGHRVLRVEDRELITGQNPRSDHPLAAKLVAALDRSLSTT